MNACLLGLHGVQGCIEAALTSSKVSFPSEAFLLSAWLAVSQRCMKKAPHSDVGVSCSSSRLVGVLGFRVLGRICRGLLLELKNTEQRRALTMMLEGVPAQLSCADAGCSSLSASAAPKPTRTRQHTCHCAVPLCAASQLSTQAAHIGLV